MRAAWTVAVAAFVLAAAAGSSAPVEPDDCSLQFRGTYRKWTKMRLADLPGTTLFDEGRPVSVPDWYMRVARPLDPQVADLIRTRKFRPRAMSSRPMQGIETIRVVVRGFLLAVKFERHGSGGGDNDFHCEIGAEPSWETNHLVVEIGPGPAYCEARTLAWRLVKEDSERSGQHVADTYILKEPVHVDVDGYVFLDAWHAAAGRTDFADATGKAAGRGITGRGKPRRVRGLWEIHPVVKLRRVE